MIISIDVANIQQSSIYLCDLKNSQPTKNKGNFLYLIKNICRKLTTNTTLSVDIFKCFSFKMWPKQGCCLWPVLFNNVLEVIASEIRQEKEIKGILIAEVKIKWSIFTDNRIFCLERSHELYKRHLKVDK